MSSIKSQLTKMAIAKSTSTTQYMVKYSQVKRPSESMSFVLEIDTLPIDELVEEIKAFGSFERKNIKLFFHSTAKSAQNHQLSISMTDDSEDSRPSSPIKITKIRFGNSDDSDSDSEVRSIPLSVLRAIQLMEAEKKKKTDSAPPVDPTAILINLRFDLSKPKISGEEAFALVEGNLELCNEDRMIWSEECSFVGTAPYQVKIPKTSWTSEVNKLRLTINARVDFQTQMLERVAGFPNIQLKIFNSKVGNDETQMKAKTCEDFYLSDAFSDISIQCGEEKLPAHRFVLSLASPVFAAMLTTNMKEGEESVINITDTTAKVWKELLRFIYTGAVETQTQTWTLDMAQNVLNLAKMYDFPQLQKICENILNSMITVDNALNLYEWARLHEVNDFMEEIKKFIFANRATILKGNIQEVATRFPDLIGKLIDVENGSEEAQD